MSAAASPDDPALRAAIVSTARAMNALPLNRGTSGNVSARCDSGFLITPSALPYDRMAPEDVVAMTLDGGVVSGSRAPSTEWPFHREIYRTRAEVRAIVHTHPPFGTTLACLNRGIPAFHYMVAVAGGRDIRCARYATFGSDELARHAVEALEGRKACLLAHHGMITVGDDLESALALSVEVEALAEMYWRAIQVEEPPRLSDEEMERVISKFRSYRTS
ncbi:MAG TPA: class II aldolase/adducin family protein [Casimicrobiaceae bacterium]|nr:class II aldolase/adducin family protein [Casimicrobiaceae bacterium]